VYHKNLFIKLFKSLAPGRAAGGIFNLAASGGEVSHLESGLRMTLPLVPRGKVIRGFFKNTHSCLLNVLNVLRRSYSSENQADLRAKITTLTTCPSGFTTEVFAISTVVTGAARQRM